MEVAAQHLAMLRAEKRDGVAGYSGLAIALSAIGRVDEAEGILRSAMAEFGEAHVLLGEYAQVAACRGALREVSERWERYRFLFPEKADGYRHAAFATIYR